MYKNQSKNFISYSFRFLSSRFDLIKDKFGSDFLFT